MGELQQGSDDCTVIGVVEIRPVVETEVRLVDQLEYVRVESHEMSPHDRPVGS